MNGTSNFADLPWGRRFLYPVLTLITIASIQFQASGKCFGLHQDHIPISAAFIHPSQQCRALPRFRCMWVGESPNLQGAAWVCSGHRVPRLGGERHHGGAHQILQGTADPGAASLGGSSRGKDEEEYLDGSMMLDVAIVLFHLEVSFRVSVRFLPSLWLHLVLFFKQLTVD